MTVRTMIFGPLLILIGLLLFGRSLGILFFDFGDLIRMLLPLGFIGFGIWLIIRRKKLDEQFRSRAAASDIGPDINVTVTPPPHVNTDPDGFAKHQAEQTTTGTAHSEPRVSAIGDKSASGRVKYSKLVGDLIVDLGGVNLNSVDVSSGLGDIEIRVKDGKLSTGLNRIVVSGFIGNVRILLPAGLPYFARCSNFIGDIELCGKSNSGFSNSSEAGSDDYNSAKSKLFIAANTFLGDIRIIVV